MPAGDTVSEGGKCLQAIRSLKVVRRHSSLSRVRAPSNMNRGGRGHAPPSWRGPLLPLLPALGVAAVVILLLGAAKETSHAQVPPHALRPQWQPEERTGGGLDAVPAVDGYVHSRVSVLGDVRDGIASFEARLADNWGEETLPLFREAVSLIGDPAAIKSKIKRALRETKAWKILVMGTSVAAGHDNNYNQSFPLVLEQYLKPIFGAAGVSVSTRNAAMGANPVMLDTACISARAGGQDVDVVRSSEHFSGF